MKRFLLTILSVLFALSLFAIEPFCVVRADDGVISVGELTVHFIDVGQGDACIVELPDKRTMLIDAGEDEKLYPNISQKVDEYIKANIKDDEGNVITYFDIVILTHSDSDHIGGMDYILERYHAKTTYRPNQECEKCEDPAKNGTEDKYRFWGTAHGKKNTIVYHDALEAAYKYSEEVIVTNPHDPDQNCIESTDKDDPYTINFYSPIKPNYSKGNNYSPIIVIEYHGRKIVLSGDAEKLGEGDFVKEVNKGEDPRYAVFDDSFCADIIKLGHHGSDTSSTKEYLEVMTKSNRRSNVFVIISCGVDNSYGHPDLATFTTLAELGFSDENILRTDRREEGEGKNDFVGDIVINIEQVDGEYKAVYNGRVGGSGDNTGSTGGQTGGSVNNPGQNNSGTTADTEDDLLSYLFAAFNEMNIYVKIAAIVIAIIIVVLILVLVLKGKKKGRKRR